MTEKNKLGMVLFLLSESVFFVLLILAYVTYHRSHGNGPTAADSLNVGKTALFSLFLLASSFTAWRAETGFRRSDRRGKVLVWLGVTIAFGITFLIGQGLEYADLIGRNITISRDLFGTTFFTLTGFHGLHVTAGLIMLGALLWMLRRTASRPAKPAAFEVVALYWHFVDGVWVLIFGVVYLWAFFG